VILHLVAAAEWAALCDADEYTPPSLATEGFVHCSGDDDVMLDVANAFYRQHGEVVVLSLDEHNLRAPVRWEPPAPLPPDWSGTPRFPHVYGPINLDAVVAVRPLRRGADGSFVGYGDGFSASR
jgi:uncharacterized protein (DUF952 family)